MLDALTSRWTSPARVQGVQARRRPRPRSARARDRQRAVGREALVERWPGHVAHGQVAAAAGLAGSSTGDEVRVARPRRPRAPRAGSGARSSRRPTRPRMTFSATVVAVLAPRGTRCPSRPRRAGLDPVPAEGVAGPGARIGLAWTIAHTRSSSPARPDRLAPAMANARLPLYYVVARRVVAVVVTVRARPAGRGVAAARDRRRLPRRASPACLGSDFDVKQSGHSSPSTAPTASGGALRFEHGRLTGDVTCVDGRQAPLDARVRRRHRRAPRRRSACAPTLVRDPPAPGAQKPRVPAGIGGDYTLAPSRSASAASWTLTGTPRATRSRRASATPARLTYRNGMLEGTVECKARRRGDARRAGAEPRAHAHDRRASGPRAGQREKQREFRETLCAASSSPSRS